MATKVLSFRLIGAALAVVVMSFAPAWSVFGGLLDAAFWQQPGLLPAGAADT